MEQEEISAAIAKHLNTQWQSNYTFKQNYQ